MTSQHRVEVTPKAAQIILEAFAEQNVNASQGYLRLGSRPGGCSGFKYTMDFAEASQVTPDDVTFSSQGVNVVVKRKDLEDVLGSVLVDYKDGSVMERGFTFRPLGEQAVCGCGQSFTPVKTA